MRGLRIYFASVVPLLTEERYFAPFPTCLRLVFILIQRISYQVLASHSHDGDATRTNT